MNPKHERSSTWCSLRTLGAARRCAIVYRGGGYCAWCRVPLTQDTAQIDHVVPRRHGGSDDPANLVAACSECNARRPDVTGDLAQLCEPLDTAAGFQLALCWYPWLPARYADNEARKRNARDQQRERQRAARLEGLGGDAFPFGAAEPEAAAAE